MARINLLPWREAERKRRQQEFGLMVLAGVVIAMLGVVGAHMQINSEINAQSQRNAYLQREIDVVEQQIAEIRDLGKTKASLLARMNIIQELQSSRPQIVHLFDEIVTTMPEGVFLDQIDTKRRTRLSWWDRPNPMPGFRLLCEILNDQGGWENPGLILLRVKRRQERV